MARLPRLALAEQLHHVLLLGHNSQAVFQGSADYQLILALLAEHALREQV